jgi:hypothetical protein
MPRCAAFGHEPETAIAHGAFGGREGIRCAVGAAVRRAVTRKTTTHPSPAFVTLRLVTTVSPHSILSLEHLGPLEAAIFCFRSPLVARSFRWRDDCYGNCMSCTSSRPNQLSTGSSGGALR